ncbi:protein EMRE homolog, mitochondrial [Fopius arisanus]|uniref:Essential MCU regulator, mitochondrial n=1 Tax=Fopius arisanus TaxID=64838 RepID=A0A9R1TGT4_9HYME|nr:PREDICTED: protein EMRE homolog, mitochondrial [Fopius arisanus]XP_011308903.1 PREDICTED: protein EMRE homolog, mitochondrial [Fopius arisanus]
MALTSRVISLLRSKTTFNELNTVVRRTAITTRSGAVLPRPKREPFGFLRVFFGVAIGVMIGATLSKNIANFLEENDLFVPSDEDDDD